VFLWTLPFVSIHARFDLFLWFANSKQLRIVDTEGLANIKYQKKSKKKGQNTPHLKIQWQALQYTTYINNIADTKLFHRQHFAFWTGPQGPFSNHLFQTFILFFLFTANRLLGVAHATTYFFVFHAICDEKTKVARRRSTWRPFWVPYNPFGQIGLAQHLFQTSTAAAATATVATTRGNQFFTG
jgi:hypothetical protein